MGFFDEPLSYPTGIPDHVCQLYEELALKVYQAGHAKYSSRAILHQIRWHHQIERGDIHFKINNNYSARLARWFMKKHPKLLGFFETRDGADKEHDMHGYMNLDAPYNLQIVIGKRKMLLDDKEQAALFLALEVWFESQGVPRRDRAFYCAMASGKYVTIQTICQKQTGAFLRNCIKILQAALKESAEYAAVNLAKNLIQEEDIRKSGQSGGKEAPQ